MPDAICSPTSQTPRVIVFARGADGGVLNQSPRDPLASKAWSEAKHIHDPLSRNQADELVRRDFGNPRRCLQAMSRKGVVGPLHLNPQNAAIAALVIEERTGDVELEGTPFAALRTFGRKLGRAVRRRRTSVTEVVLWTVKRNEAEAGYRYLMAFSHKDVPSTFLSYEQMDAVHDVALDLLMALLSRRGRKGLDREAIERRLNAWDHPESSEIDVPNPR